MAQNLTIDEYVELLSEVIELDARRYDTEENITNKEE